MRTTLFLINVIFGLLILQFKCMPFEWQIATLVIVLLNTIGVIYSFKKHLENLLKNENNSNNTTLK